MSSIADALSGGARFIKWDEVGMNVPVTGSITHVEMRQARKFQSTDLDYWDDGKPKMQAVLTLATSLREATDPEDDGTRSISINLWSGQKAALAAACKAAGVPEPVVGQAFTATWTSGVGRSGDPRLFSYALGAAPAQGIGDALGTGQPAAAPQPAVAAAPAPAPVPQQPVAADPVTTARNMLALGVDPGAIAAATGLTPEVVAALKNVA